MANDYISRDSVLEFLMVWNNVEDYNWGEKNIIGAAIQMVEDIPAADVRPVVRGQWVHGKETGREYIGNALEQIFYENWACSVCGYLINDRQYSRINYNFCPNCGADMRPEAPDGSP